MAASSKREAAGPSIAVGESNISNQREVLNVCGVEVDFPFRPYPCQLVYMEKVVESLQRGVNAILESPTGTGKTLCLLCAALGWREDFLRKQRGLAAAVGFGDEGGEVTGDLWDSGPGDGQQSTVATVPKIIYASRTHSQLSQVVRELKNTKYRPRMAIIGSREQLCIHPEVSKKESNFEKVHHCRAKVQANSCMYCRNVDVKKLKTKDKVMDIEDLVMAGTKQRMCPYYLAREMQAEADIIFMPYNYILDIKTRKMHNINVQGTIIILDEAHNIERVCEDSASFDLTSTDISLCISDLDTILKSKKEEIEFSSSDEGIGEDFQDYINLKEFFLSLEEKMDKLDLSTSSKGVVKPGEYMHQFLEGLGLRWDTASTLLNQCGKAISWLTADSRSFRSGSNIEKFMDAVTVVFSHSGRGSTHSSAHSYKVFMKSEEGTKTKKKSDVWTAPAAAESSSKRETRTLSYWCFSPGHAMSDLTGQGVRSVILTSGTLSPLDSFSCELHVEFPIQYEGPHVISKEQVWVGVVSRGCDGVPLNSSYENRSTASYQSSLGNTIVNFSRIVPHGMLVFFPSYPVMNSCILHWRENGILQRMEQFKPYFQEPRKKADFNPTMDAFYEAINDPKKDGAIFFAVCRGKVSEGLDFANKNGRAVIITGLPYPPRMDPKVDLKMKHLQESQSSQSVKVLGGQEWYKQQASRAVNQAVGRVIRHKHDYGAIILCDQRFAYRGTIDQLPRWVRPHVQTYDKFGLVQRDLTRFFTNANSQFGEMAPKKCGVQSTEVKGDGELGSRGRDTIVVKENPMWRSQILDLQDAGKVELHLTSRKAPEASTLNQLKKMTATRTKNLLGSLDQAEASRGAEEKVPNLHKKIALKVEEEPSLSQSILSGHSSGNTEDSTVKAKPKRTFVVSKRRNQVQKIETIAGFIDEIKTNLSQEAYSTFKTALALYHKKKDIHVFLENVRDIFKQPAHYPLLKKLHSFILEEHRESFGLFYHEITGSELGTVDLLPSSQHKLQVERKRKAFECKDQPKTKSKKLDGLHGASTSHSQTESSLLLDTSHLNYGQGHLNSAL